MKLFLDSGNIDEIKKAYELGVVDGITTNPSLIKKNCKGGNKEFLDNLLQMGKNDPIIVTLTTHDKASMIEEACGLSEIYKNIIIKLYMTAHDLQIVGELNKHNIKSHISVIYSVNQAFLAAKAGAALMSPFIGRADDFGADGIKLLKSIIKMKKECEFNTSVMAASIRNPRQAQEAIMAGTDILTLPYDVLDKMFKHPATDVGVAQFMEDAKK